MTHHRTFKESVIEIARDFFRLLRSWYEESSKISETWKRFRLVLIHTEDVPISFKIQQSPFNVGTVIELPEFDTAQVQKLVKQYKLNLTDAEVQALMAMVGGHPYLLRLALDKAAHKQLDKLLQEAPTDKGIYREHLHFLFNKLQEDANLVVAMKQVIASSEPIQIEPQIAFKLNSMGLIKEVENNAVIPRCELYRR